MPNGGAVYSADGASTISTEHRPRIARAFTERGDRAGERSSAAAPSPIGLDSEHYDDVKPEAAYG